MLLSALEISNIPSRDQKLQAFYMRVDTKIAQVFLLPFIALALLSKRPPKLGLPTTNKL
jgi:hypothetical protein